MVIHEPLVTTRKVRARFSWRHHFWGNYHATIIADCGSLADANACKAFLRDLHDYNLFQEIKIVEEAVVALYSPGDSTGEDRLGDLLEPFRVLPASRPRPSPEEPFCEHYDLGRWCSRCDRKHDIGDTAHSIDWAQPFEIEFEAPYLDHPDQRMLPGC